MDEKQFQERFLLFVTKNMDKISQAQLRVVDIPKPNEIVFTFAFGKDAVDSWFKFFPDDKAKVEAKLGVKL